MVKRRDVSGRVRSDLFFRVSSWADDLGGTWSPCSAVHSAVRAGCISWTITTALARKLANRHACQKCCQCMLLNRSVGM
jgi:hypothetical protein